MNQYYSKDGQLLFVVGVANTCDLANQQVNAAVTLVSINCQFEDDTVVQLGRLYLLGCRQFMFLGTFSERLHDAFDNHVIDVLGGEEIGVTTFHNNEPVEDVLALFDVFASNQSSHPMILIL